MLEAMTTRGPDWRASPSTPTASSARRPERPGTALLAALGRDHRLGSAGQADRSRDGPGSPIRAARVRLRRVRLARGADVVPGRRPPGRAQVTVPGFGRSMVVVKDVGAPAAICARYGIGGWAGYQGIGHTRMATESAVTTAHSHPFAPAADLALVHNGSFSNYATVRGRLAAQGIRCDTDNDSEVAARLVAARMAEGADLADGLRTVLQGDGRVLHPPGDDQDAVRGDPRLLRLQAGRDRGDPDYVAMASEYQALAGLPGITGAGSSSRCPRRSTYGPGDPRAARSCPPARSTRRWPIWPAAPRVRVTHPGGRHNLAVGISSWRARHDRRQRRLFHRRPRRRARYNRRWLRRLVGRGKPNVGVDKGAGQRLGMRRGVRPWRAYHHRRRRLRPAPGSR